VGSKNPTFLVILNEVKDPLFVFLAVIPAGNLLLLAGISFHVLGYDILS